MTSGQRTYLIIGLAVLAAIILAGFGAATSFVNSAKPRLEMLVSARLGMQVSCRSLHLSLLPLAIEAREVKISNKDSDVALIPTLQARVALLALFKGQLRISTLNLKRPEFTLTRWENGVWNIEKTKREEKETPGRRSFFISTLNIQDGHLVLRAGANPMEMQGISLTVRDLVLAADNGRPLLARLSLTGDFNCPDLRYGDKTVIRDLASQLQGTAGSFVFTPLTFQAFGGSAKGKVTTSLAGENFLVGVQLELFRLRAEDLFSSMTKEQLLRGEVEMVLDVTARGGGQQELLRSMSGKASMSGQDLKLIRLNLDNLLEEFIQSQQFDLVDLGAFLIVGPFGPALTKGFDLGMVANAAQGGSTEVRKLVSRWQIEEGRAVARDVALATGKNRMAMRGEVDIAAERFQNLVVAVVDAGGCAVVRQEIDGPFESPEVKKPGFIQSAAGPLINIFKGPVTFLTGQKCEVFYSGSVAAPGK